MKKTLLAVVMIFLLFSNVVQAANATTSYVDVKIAPFNVTINNVMVQNVVNRYPLIIYKNITYFPMNYADSRFLGVETTWSPEKGLSVSKGESGAYRVYDTYINDLSKTFKARVITSPIMVNGKPKTGGEYPFLSFRDVAYFPLTWEYAVSEFGWKYSWSKDTGLSIQSVDYENSDRESVINAINRTSFGKSYKFSYQFEGENREKSTVEGVRKGGFSLGIENKCVYNSMFELSTPLKYMETEEAIGWEQVFLCDGANSHSISVSASYPVGFSDHPYVQDEIGILGEMRDAVKEVKDISSSLDSERTYEINFNSDSEWNSRKITVTMNEGREITHMVIENKDVVGKYSIQMKISEIIYN